MINRVFVTHLQPTDAPPYRLAMGLFATVCAFSGVSMIMTDTVYLPLQTLNYGDLVLFAHAILMTFFYICFFIIAKHGAVKNSLTFYLAPLIGMGWGIVLFGEDITLFFVASLAIIFYSLHLLNKSP